MHFCDGSKNQDKKKEKAFAWWVFFPLQSIWYSHVYTQHRKPLPRRPSWSQDDAMTIKAARDWQVTQQHKPDPQPGLSHKHIGVRPASAYDAQPTLVLTPRAAGHPLSASPAALILQSGDGCSVTSSPGAGCQVPRGWLWEPSAWRAVRSDSSWREGGQDPKDAIAAACFLRHTTAVAFCFFLLVQHMFPGNRNCLRPVTGGGFSVPCFPITGNGRSQWWRCSLPSQCLHSCSLLWCHLAAAWATLWVHVHATRILRSNFAQPGPGNRGCSVSKRLVSNCSSIFAFCRGEKIKSKSDTAQTSRAGSGHEAWGRSHHYLIIPSCC